MNPTCDVALSGRYDFKRSAAALGVSRNKFLELRKAFPHLLPVHYHVDGQPFLYGKDLIKFHATERPALASR